jgi:hypothetical protein
MSLVRVRRLPYWMVRAFCQAPSDLTLTSTTTPCHPNVSQYISYCLHSEADNELCAAPYRLQSNEAPTAEEVKILQEFIQSRRGGVSHILLRIDMEDVHIETCSKVIANLEMTIPRRKYALKLHQDNLTAFLEIRSRLLQLKQLDTSELELELEPCSGRLYPHVNALGYALILRLSKSIDREVKLLTEEVKKLLDIVVTLEKELERGKSSLFLFQCARRDLITSRMQLKEDISIVIGSLKTFLRVPVDIWRTDGEEPGSAISPIKLGAPPLLPGGENRGQSVSSGDNLGYGTDPTLPPPRTSSYGGIGGVLSGGTGERRSTVKGPVNRSKTVYPYVYDADTFRLVPSPPQTSGQYKFPPPSDFPKPRNFESGVRDYQSGNARGCDFDLGRIA